MVMPAASDLETEGSTISSAQAEKRSVVIVVMTISRIFDFICVSFDNLIECFHQFSSSMVMPAASDLEAEGSITSSAQLEIDKTDTTSSTISNTRFIFIKFKLVN